MRGDPQPEDPTLRLRPFSPGGWDDVDPVAPALRAASSTSSSRSSGRSVTAGVLQQRPGQTSPSGWARHGWRSITECLGRDQVPDATALIFDTDLFSPVVGAPADIVRSNWAEARLMLTNGRHGARGTVMTASFMSCTRRRSAPLALPAWIVPTPPGWPVPLNPFHGPDPDRAAPPGREQPRQPRRMRLVGIRQPAPARGHVRPPEEV